MFETLGVNTKKLALASSFADPIVIVDDFKRPFDSRSDTLRSHP